MSLQYFLKQYLQERPLFLSLIRAKEAFLYQKYLPFKKPVLDIGCGDGMFAKLSFANKFKVQSSKFKVNERIIDIGLDVKDSRIEEAKRLGVYKKLVIYDGVKIPFPDNYFSTIVSNCVLEHVTHLDSVISEAYRVLKPGGVFLTTVMAAPWEEYLFGSIFLGSWYQNWMRKKQVHLNLYNHKNWDKEFKKSGFRIVGKVGYLDQKASRLIDFCHYLSIPSLISYKLFKKWVLWKYFVDYYPLKNLANSISDNVNPDKSAALFYLLRK